jgi:hypothetical protein
LKPVSSYPFQTQKYFIQVKNLYEQWAIFNRYSGLQLSFR